VDKEDENKDLVPAVWREFAATISRGDAHAVAANIKMTQDVTPESAAVRRYEADAMVKVSENTRLLPAREQSKRLYAQLATNVVMGGGLATIAGLILRGGGPGWEKWFALVLLGVAAMFGPAVKQAIEALKKKTD
jgi:hypothetical protein